MIKQIPYLCCFMIFFGCAKFDDSNIKYIAEKYNASGYKQDYSLNYDTENGETSIIKIEFSDIKDIENQADIELLASTMLYEYLSLCDSLFLTDYRFIEISLESKTKNHDFVKRYNLERLYKSVNPAMYKTLFFINNTRSYDLISNSELFDFNYVEDSIVSKMVNDFVEIDSKYGPQDKATIYGFKYDESPKKKLPLIKIYCLTEGKKVVSDFELWFSERELKIVFLNYSCDLYD